MLYILTATILLLCFFLIGAICWTNVALRFIRSVTGCSISAGDVVVLQSFIEKAR